MNNKENNKNIQKCKSSKQKSSNTTKQEIKESYKMGIEYYEELEEHKEF
jgi:hypothetical protein